MKAALAFLFLFVTACGSPSDPPNNMMNPDAGGGSGSNHPIIDAPAATMGFKIDLGQPYESASAVSISAIRTNNVYAGYFEASSSFASVPNISVSLHAPGASISTNQTFPCARSTDNNDLDETSVSIKWLDGDMYYTNFLPNPTCTITITAASQTSISASITGSIYDESTQNPSSFTASFVAAVTQ